MTSFRTRPRFKVNSPKTIDHITQLFKAQFQQKDNPCVGYVVQDHVILKVHHSEQHFWSPQLDLTLESSENGTLIRGLYGPNPHIWTLFAMSYLGLGVLFTFIAIIGFSRLSLGMPAPILWILPALFGIVLVIYIFGQVGQKIGAEQTFTLHHFVEETLGERIHVF